MNTKANYFKLGLFVIVAVALLCAGVIVLGAGKLFETTVLIETYMAESVEGISPGSAVKYRGIELGKVASVSLASRKYDPDAFKEGHFGSTVLLELAIRESALPAITDREFAGWLAKARDAGLRARTASSGLTGPAYVEFVFLDPKEFPPPALTWTPPALYVPSAPSTTQVLISAVQRILRKIEAIDMQGVVSDVDTLMKTANTKLDELDVQGLDEKAISLLDDLKAKIDAVDTAKINDEAVALLEEIRSSNDRLHEILNNPDIDPSIADLRATLENAKQATARIDDLLADPRVEQLMTSLERAGDELPPALTDIRRTVRRIDRLIESQQSTIESALTELNQALDNIKNITEDASQNPARILFGNPPPHVKPGDKQ